MAWLASTQGLLLLLFAAVAAALGLFVWRLRRRRRSRPEPAVALAAEPDLEVEDAVAAESPAEHWLERARELIERGELRLAVRALYLAGLSHLTARELIAPARFKSNLDYLRELARRARRSPRVTELFAENVELFERIWYGEHLADRESIDRLRGNLRDLGAYEAP